MSKKSRSARPRSPSLVAQITTRLGDTVIDAREVGRISPTARAWPWCAAGLGLFLGGAGLFAAEASLDWDGYRGAQRRALASEAQLPETPGWGLGGVGLLLALAGLLPLGVGLRRRADRPAQDFTIGEGRRAALHVPGEGLPDRDAFTLVRVVDGAIDLRFGTWMKGHVMVDGRALPLAQVAAAAGHARDAVCGLRLDEGDRCVLEHDALTFEIEASAPPILGFDRPALDRPLWWSTAAAALAVGAIVAAKSYAAPEPLADDGDAAFASATVIPSERMIAVMTGPIPVILEEEPPVEFEERDDAGGSGQRHRGEEGHMGKPSARSKAGLYAMRGPRNAVPQLARSFDPALAGRQAGILGQLQTAGGSTHAGPYAVGNESGDVWGGLTGAEIGESYGVGGLGLVGGGANTTAEDRYAAIHERGFSRVADAPRSTFAIDVDTAAYSNVRRFLNGGDLPPVDAVRVEEMINYFDYQDPAPTGARPLAIHAEVADAPWDPDHRLVRVGVKARALAVDQVPPRNLVFLIDTSGSMAGPDRLELIKAGMRGLVDTLGPDDRVSIVTYAGVSGVALPVTPGSSHRVIKESLTHLRPGGGTHGAAGIALAYAMARSAFVEGGINRVILATDGDFNVGVSNHDELVKIIERERESGVFLSVLGVGRGNLRDHMMEQIADHGDGNYAYLDSADEAERVLVANANGTLATIAKDVKIQVEFNPREVESYRLVGYENRALADRDFADDRKDGGEAGSGHAVTALYEVVPTGRVADRRGADLLTVNVRYKDPDGDQSELMALAVRDDGHDAGQGSNAFRLAASVAAFGMVLRGSEHVGAWDLGDVDRLLQSVNLYDPRAEIAELRTLVRRARLLRGRTAMR